MDFVTGLPTSTNCKRKAYDFILVIVDRVRKMMNCDSVKIIINASRLAKIIINMVIKCNGQPDSIISEIGLYSP